MASLLQYVPANVQPQGSTEVQTVQSTQKGRSCMWHPTATIPAEWREETSVAHEQKLLTRPSNAQQERVRTWLVNGIQVVTTYSDSCKGQESHLQKWILRECRKFCCSYAACTALMPINQQQIPMQAERAPSSACLETVHRAASLWERLL